LSYPAPFSFTPLHRRVSRLRSGLFSTSSRRLYVRLVYFQPSGVDLAKNCCYSSLMSRKHPNPMNGDPADLPFRSDGVFCSKQRGARESVEQSGLPQERFEWSRQLDWDTGEWRIHGEARPTLRDRCIGGWLRFEIKVRRLRRALRGFRWWK
jgi:hypothetical protein